MHGALTLLLVVQTADLEPIKQVLGDSRNCIFISICFDFCRFSPYVIGKVAFEARAMGLTAEYELITSDVSAGTNLSCFFFFLFLV